MDCKVVACETCTLRCLLYHGKRESSTPLVFSFFKVMLGAQCSQVLFFPPMFAPVVEPLLHEETFLEDSRGMKWKVKVSYLDGSFVLKEGWEAFVLDNGLKVGDFVVFNYIKGSRFFVQIFDQTACEKLNSFANDSVTKGQIKRVKNDINLTAENGPSDPVGKDSLNNLAAAAFFLSGSDCQDRYLVNNVQKDKVALKNTANGEIRPEDPQAVSAVKLLNTENQEECQQDKLGLSNRERLKNNSSYCGSKRTIVGHEKCSCPADTSSASQCDAGLANKKCLDASDVEMITSGDRDRMMNSEMRMGGPQAVSGEKGKITEESQNVATFSSCSMEKSKNNSLTGGSMEWLKSNSGTAGTHPVDASFISRHEAGLAIKKPSSATAAETVTSKERAKFVSGEQGTREPQAVSVEKLAKRDLKRRQEECRSSIFSLERLRNNSGTRGSIKGVKNNSYDVLSKKITDGRCQNPPLGIASISQHKANKKHSGEPDVEIINCREKEKLPNVESHTGGAHDVSEANLVKGNSGRKIEVRKGVILGLSSKIGIEKCPPYSADASFISQGEAGLPNKKHSGAPDVEMIYCREKDKLPNIESQTVRAQAVAEAKLVKGTCETKLEKRKGVLLGLPSKTGIGKHPRPADASFISRGEAGLAKKNPSGASNVANIGSEETDGLVNIPVKSAGYPLPTSVNNSGKKKKGIQVEQVLNSNPPVAPDEAVNHGAQCQESFPWKFLATVSCVISENDEYSLQLPSPLPPGSYTGKSNGRKLNVVLLSDPNKYLWPVLYLEAKGLNLLTGGWGAFMKFNKLHAGDECTFRLLNGDEGICKVHIVRK